MNEETNCLDLPNIFDETLDTPESKSDFNQDPEDDDFLPTEPDLSKRHPFQCDICDKILTTKQSLKLHALTHVDPANRPIFRCEICEATFKSQGGLSYHLETKHTAAGERKKLPCPTCGRIFKSAEGRKIHMTIQHGAGGPIFKCKECPMVFARKPHLDLHMTTHGSGLHVCTICGKSYARLKDLSRHETTCGVKELCCPVCGKQLRTDQALQNHKKKCRPGSRNFCCLTCGHGFATEQALKSHEAIHRRTFRCAECPKTFVTVLALRNHEQTKHCESNGYNPGVGERRGRPQKNIAKEEGKVRMRRSKYDLFIGLEHLADPSTLIEEEKPDKDDLKPAATTPKRIPCEHCPLKFASEKALQNHGQRRHWEVLGLAEPAAEKRGRKRKRPLERVPRRIRRPRAKVNRVELVDLPEAIECGAQKEVGVGPVKSEDATHEEPMIDDPVESVAIARNSTYDEEKSAPIDPIEDSHMFATNEIIIKEEIVEFEGGEFDYFENYSSYGEGTVDELTFENIVADLEVPQDPNTEEVDALDVVPTLEMDVSEEPQISKELVIRLEKLDYSALVKQGSYKKPSIPRRECEHCGKTFAQQYYLAQHRVREHGSTETPTKVKPPPKITGPPSYRCEECDKAYHVEHKLKAHNEKVHGIAATSESPYARTCKHCGQTLISWSSLVKHVKAFHGLPIDESKFISCSSCRAKFFTEEEMKEHVCLKSRKREPKERSFKCDLCRKTYASLLHLEAHYAVHPEYQNFKCDQCSKMFFKESGLASHKRSMHNPDPASLIKKIRPFKSKYKNPFPRMECEQCGQTFAYRYRLALHRVTEHGSTETPVASRRVAGTTFPRNFHCDQCDKSYHLQVNLAIHQAKVHGVGEAPLKEARALNHACKHCNKVVSSWDALVYHRKFIHGEDIVKTQFVQCASCRIKFATEEEMAQHICLKGVVRRTERPFKCDLCEKTYFAKHHLEGHYSAHPEYHKVKCDQCPKGFYNETWLKKHKKNIHIAEEAYIECETCNQRFKNHKCLKRHQEIHKDNVLHCCEHCGLKFQRLINLRSHVIRVHDARAIPCAVCGKLIKGKRNLKRHMRIHNNDRRFKCSIPACGKAFFSSSSLRVHVQSHTKDYTFKCKFCEYGTVIRKKIQQHEQRKHNHNRFAEENDA